MKARLVGRIVIDHRDHTITVDGEAFEWAIEAEPVVEMTKERDRGVMRVGILANHVKVIGPSGDPIFWINP